MLTKDTVPVTAVGAHPHDDIKLYPLNPLDSYSSLPLSRDVVSLRIDNIYSGLLDLAALRKFVADYDAEVARLIKEREKPGVTLFVNDLECPSFGYTRREGYDYVFHYMGGRPGESFSEFSTRVAKSHRIIETRPIP